MPRCSSQVAADTLQNSFSTDKDDRKKKKKIAQMQAKNGGECCAKRGAKKSVAATSVISPCDLLLADMLC